MLFMLAGAARLNFASAEEREAAVVGAYTALLGEPATAADLAAIREELAK